MSIYQYLSLRFPKEIVYLICSYYSDLMIPEWEKEHKKLSLIMFKELTKMTEGIFRNATPNLDWNIILLSECGRGWPKTLYYVYKNPQKNYFISTIVRGRTFPGWYIRIYVSLIESIDYKLGKYSS